MILFWTYAGVVHPAIDSEGVLGARILFVLFDKIILFYGGMYVRSLSSFSF